MIRVAMTASFSLVDVAVATTKAAQVRLAVADAPATIFADERRSAGRATSFGGSGGVGWLR